MTLIETRGREFIPEITMKVRTRDFLRRTAEALYALDDPNKADNGGRLNPGVAFEFSPEGVRLVVAGRFRLASVLISEQIQDNKGLSTGIKSLVVVDGTQLARFCELLSVKAPDVPQIDDFCTIQVFPNRVEISDGSGICRLFNKPEEDMLENNSKSLFKGKIVGGVQFDTANAKKVLDKFDKPWIWLSGISYLNERGLVFTTENPFIKERLVVLKDGSSDYFTPIPRHRYKADFLKQHFAERMLQMRLAFNLSEGCLIGHLRSGLSLHALFPMPESNKK